MKTIATPTNRPTELTKAIALARQSVEHSAVRAERLGRRRAMAVFFAIMGVSKDAANTYWLSAVGRSYDVSPDGMRFLMLKEAARPPSHAYLPRERIIRSYEFSFSRQNSSTSSVSGSKFCVNFTVNGCV